MMLEIHRKVAPYRLSLLSGLIIMLCVVGCTSVQPSIASDAVKEPATDSGIGQLLATADAAQGKRLYLQCRACHSLEAGGANKVGPNLHGFLGNTAGHAEGFAYSDALLESGVVWTPETLDEWLARPSDFLPGNRMIFAGVSDPADRADLILYLQQATRPAD
jgi:cytochrome c